MSNKQGTQIATHKFECFFGVIGIELLLTQEIDEKFFNIKTHTCIHKPCASQGDVIPRLYLGPPVVLDAHRPSWHSLVIGTVLDVAS